MAFNDGQSFVATVVNTRCPSTPNGEIKEFFEILLPSHDPLNGLDVRSCDVGSEVRSVGENTGFSPALRTLRCREGHVETWQTACVEHLFRAYVIELMYPRMPVWSEVHRTEMPGYKTAPSSCPSEPGSPPSPTTPSCKTHS